MPIIKVVKRFLLKDDKDQLTEYLPGEYDVDDATAAHWYVKAHLEGYEEPSPKQGTQQYAQAELQMARAARLGEPIAPPTQAKPPESATLTVRFAGRELPKVPSQLDGFTDPRTIDPRGQQSA